MKSEGKQRRAKGVDFECGRTIALVGMMGVGKTTVGRRLAERLGLPFFDTDEEIEKAAGMSVAELFSAHGEDSFRRGEAQIIARLLEGPPHVLATGGGSILDPETRRLLRERALTIWLRADLDVIARRAARRDTRPLLKGGEPREILSRLLDARAPFYARSDLVIDGQPGAHARTVDALIEAIRPLMTSADNAATERAP
ncbi:MAG: shikimate kinase [Alphaproteobacteria bacterium]|nr:shikimate kinase [Alphaproteobacteria bacterium]